MSSKDNYYYDSYGRLQRRNPQDVDPYAYSGSSMSTQGRRTVLPPLTSVFPPTSPSPATAAYPAYTQPRTSHDVGYGQYDPYAVSAQQQMQQSYPFYPQQTADSRYSGQTAQQSYPRTSPPIPNDPRRLPPLSVPQPTTDRYQGVPYYSQSHPDPNLISPASDVRSPQASYPYQQYQSVQSSLYPPTATGSSSSRAATHPTATMVHHPSMHAGHAMGVERSVSRHVPQMPYPRQPVAAVPEYEPRPEPTIKKKRKRADARQLEVLNATYNRTAFPSTEERAALAKQLDMSARSVQIWFQNKRQSMRQGSGRSAASASTSSGPSAVVPPSTTPAPAPVPSPPVPANVASTSAGEGSAAARYGHRASSPATYSTRPSPPVAYPSRTPQPGTYSSRSPPPGVGRSGQSPPSHTSRGGRDVDPREQWPSRGY